MKNEKIDNIGGQPNEAYEAWANVDEKNESPDWERSYKNPANKEKYEKNLNSMDKRTQQYLFRLPLNLPALLGENYVADNRKYEELTDSIIDKLNQNICDGGLNGAYLNKRGFLFRGSLADEQRGYDEESDEKSLEDFGTTLGARQNTGDAYKDNMATMDERTQAYLWRMGSNLHELVGDEGLDGDTSTEFINKMNQAIADGKLNGAYLANDGYFHIGRDAEEYRGYDMEKPSKVEASTSKLPNSTEKPTKRTDEKTPEELGFRDW